MKPCLSSSSEIESNCVCTHDKVLTATAENDFMLTHNKQANIKAAHSDGDETKKKSVFPPGMSENLPSERSFAKAQLSVI